MHHKYVDRFSVFLHDGFQKWDWPILWLCHRNLANCKATSRCQKCLKAHSAWWLSLPIHPKFPTKLFLSNWDLKKKKHLNSTNVSTSAVQCVFPYIQVFLWLTTSTKRQTSQSFCCQTQSNHSSDTFFLKKVFFKKFFLKKCLKRKKKIKNEMVPFIHSLFCISIEIE